MILLLQWNCIDQPLLFILEADLNLKAGKILVFSSTNQTYLFSQALVVNFNGILDPISHVFVKLRSKCLQPLSKLN